MARKKFTSVPEDSNEQDKKWSRYNSNELFDPGFLNEHLVNLLSEGHGLEEESLLRKKKKKGDAEDDQNDSPFEFLNLIPDKENDMKDKHRLRLSSQIHAYSASNQQELDRFNNNISHRNKAVRRLFLALDREAKRFTDLQTSTCKRAKNEEINIDDVEPTANTKAEEENEFVQDEVLASEFVGVQMCNLLLFPMLQKFSENGNIDEITWIHFLDVFQKLMRKSKYRKAIVGVVLTDSSSNSFMNMLIKWVCLSVGKVTEYGIVELPKMVSSENVYKLGMQSLFAIASCTKALSHWLLCLQLLREGPNVPIDVAEFISELSYTITSKDVTDKVYFPASVLSRAEFKDISTMNKHNLFLYVLASLDARQHSSNPITIKSVKDRKIWRLDYCIDVSSRTFDILLHLLSVHSSIYINQSSSSEELWDSTAYILIVLLQLFLLNLKYLIKENLDQSEVGLTKGVDKLRNVLADLYRFCNGKQTQKDQRLFEVICETWSTGLNIFYPSITERATFLGEIILQHSLSVQDLPLFVTTLLEKISCEPNASLLIFPVCPDELPNADTFVSMDTTESPENNVLLRVILQSLGNRAMEHLNSAAKATETATPLPQLYPTQDLLLKFAYAFQKDLSRRALQCITLGNHQASPCKYLAQYTTMVVVKSMEHIEYVIGIANKEKLSDLAWEHVQYILKQVSPVGTLLSELIAFFCASIHMELLVTPSLIDFYTLLLKYNAMQTNPNTEVTSISTQQIHISESSHPYVHSTQQHQIEIPNATCLLVSFDPLSNISLRHSLHLYHSLENTSNRITKIRDTWPAKPLVVSGNKVAFQLYCTSIDNRSNLYGYKARVLPIYAPSSFAPWSMELSYMINYAIGKCFKSSMSQKLDTKFEDVRKWLETPLLSAGLEESDSKSKNENKIALETFLHDLVNGNKTSEARMLTKHLRKSIPSAVHIANKDSKKYVNRAQRLVFATMLKHTATLQIAENYASEIVTVDPSKLREVPIVLRYLWQASNRIRQWIMSKQQELRRENEELNSDEIYALVTKDVAEKAQFLMRTTVASDSVVAQNKRVTAFKELPSNVRSISKSSPSAFSVVGSPVRVPDEFLPDLPSPSFKKRNPDSPLVSSRVWTESGSESPRKKQRNRLSQTMDSLREEQMELDNATSKKASMSVLKKYKSQLSRTSTSSPLEAVVTAQQKYSKIVDSILGFLQSNYGGVEFVHKLSAMIDSQVSQAKKRVYFMSTLLKLLQMTENPLLRASIVASFVDSFQTSTSHHYYDNLTACGPILMSEVQSASFALFAQFIQILENENSPISFKLLVIDALGSIKYRQVDSKFLLKTGLLNALNKIVSNISSFSENNQEQVDKSQLGIAAFQLFASITISLWNDNSIGITPNVLLKKESNSAHSLQQQILDTLILNLEVSLSAYSKSHSLRQKDLNVIFKTVDNEAMLKYKSENVVRDQLEQCIFELISLITYTFEPLGNVSTKLLGIALNILSLNKSSQRVLRSTLNLLVKIQSNGTMNKEVPKICSTLIEMIGKSLVMRFGESGDIDLRVSDTAYLVVTLRKMLQISSIRDHLVPMLEYILLHETKVPVPEMKSPPFSLLGALAVLGGYEEIKPRIGGPVQVELVIEGEKESGVLFQYVGSSRARVILDSDLSKEPTYVKQSQITVSTAIEIEPSLVVLTPSLASGLLCLLRSILSTSLDNKLEFFYPQLKLTTMKCIGTLLKNQTSFMSFMKEGGMELLMEVAVKPQPALGYSDLDSSLDREIIPKTFWEIAEQTQDPVSFYHNPILVHDFLPHFPFKEYLKNDEILPNFMVTHNNKSQWPNAVDDTFIIYTAQGGLDNTCSIRSNTIIPHSLPIYYFEMTIDNHGADHGNGIGLFKYGDKKGMPGWSEGSYGYHGDDACIYSPEARAYGTPFGAGDTVGCCLLIENPASPIEDRKATIFFTQNGKRFADAWTGIKVPKEGFFAGAGTISSGSRLAFNLGKNPFLFDIAHFYEEYTAAMATVEGGKGEISDTEGPEDSVKKSPMKIEQAVPVPTSSAPTKRSKNNHNNSSNINADFTKISNWIRGLKVKVLSHDLAENMKRLANLIGEVQKTDLTFQCVLVKFQFGNENEEFWWLPMTQLEPEVLNKKQPDLLYLLSKYPISHTKDLLCKMAHGMFSSSARSIIMYLLRENMLSLSQFQTIVDLKSLSAFLRIVTAENVQVPLELICKSHSQESRGEKLFKSQTDSFTKQEPALIDLDAILQSIFSSSKLESSKFLQEEIIGELLKCCKWRVDHIEESSHPYKITQRTTKEITIPGARKIYFYFSKKTRLSNSLEFSENSGNTNRHDRYTYYAGQKYISRLLDGNSINMTLFNSYNQTWGFKIYLVGAGKKLIGSKVLSRPNFDWVWWTLSSLFSHENSRKYLFHRFVFDALATYAISPRLLYKVPVFRWITYLLVNLDKFQEKPNLTQLDPLYADLYRDTQLNYATPYHTQLELLVQLANAQNTTFKEKIILALVERKIKSIKSPKKKENKKKKKGDSDESEEEENQHVEEEEEEEIEVASPKMEEEEEEEKEEDDEEEVKPKGKQVKEAKEEKQTLSATPLDEVDIKYNREEIAKEVSENLRDLRWFEELKELSILIDSIHKNSSHLPTSHINSSLTELFINPIYVESSHPYTPMPRAEITFPGAKRVTVTLSKQSMINQSHALHLYDSHNNNEDSPLAIYSGIGEDWGTSTVIEGDTFSYALIAPPSKEIEFYDQYCSHCSENLKGAAYICLTCGEICCKKCHNSHESRHVWAKITRPWVNFESEDIVPRPGLLQRESGNTHDVNCKSCNVYPIMGTRYQCGHCDYSVCKTCKKAFKHDESHAFVKLNSPLVALEELGILPIQLESWWGFKFTAIPEYEEENAKKILEENKDTIDSIINQMNIAWNIEKDAELLKYVNMRYQSTGESCLNLPLKQFTITTLELASYPLLQTIDMNVIRARFGLLRNFNKLLFKLLSYIDFSNIRESWTLGHKLVKVKMLLFLECKTNFLNTLSQLTEQNSNIGSVNLDRRKATEQESTSESLFVQAFNQLGEYSGAEFRSADKPFEVTFVNEGGTDNGGLFREAMDIFSDEIHSKVFPLLVPCANGINNTGFNRDKYIPNPSFNSPKDLSMFAFLGKIIGSHIRTRSNFNLKFPSAVWKLLLNDPITYSDLQAMDQICCQSLNVLKNIESEGVTMESFNDFINFSFTTYSCDGREVELVEGGTDKPVTWENRHEYCRLVEEYKVNEFKRQVEAMVKGLHEVIPSQVLMLMTWEEMELCLCGRPEVNLELLKKNTEYKGFSANETIVKHLWTVLEEYSNEERCMFLKFVWGRGSLPSLSSNFTQKFILQTFSKETNNNPDNFMPESHTCFFTLDLPRYSSIQVLREKLTYAIHHCRAIDTDFEVADEEEDEDD